MNLILFWTLSIFGTHQLVFAQNCRTVSGPSPNSKCVLPFTYNGKTYYECPVDPEDSTKFWCSTQVDQNGNHISNIGAYGHCGSSCPLEGSSRNLPELPRQSRNRKNRGNKKGRRIDKRKCLTQSGPDPWKQCVFSFKWDGKTFHGCT